MKIIPSFSNWYNFYSYILIIIINFTYALVDQNVLFLQQVTVMNTELPIKSIELQLVRVETCGK